MTPNDRSIDGFSLALQQSMIKCISPNFRMVYFDWSGSEWKICVVLAEENPEDAAWSEEIRSDTLDKMDDYFEAGYFSSNTMTQVSLKIIVSKDFEFAWEDSGQRLVYARRET